MADSPQKDADGVVRVRVLSDGTVLCEQAQLVSLKVTRAVNRVPTARLDFVDGNTSGEMFPLSDSEHFKPGATIRINAGYGDCEECIFEGIVVKHALRITGDNDARLVVECRDKAVKMTLGRKNANHLDKMDSDIIHALISAYPLIADVEATTMLQQNALVQYDCSDWDFMVSRAEANGLLVIVNDGTVTVKAPAACNQVPVLKVSYGMDLMEFEAEIDARTRYASTQAVARPSDSVAHLARIRGRVSFQGSAKAAVGGLIELAGVGNRFNGNVFIGGLTHAISDGNWVTEVELGLAPRWPTDRREVTAPGAAGLLPAVEGLQIGIVTKLDGDPEGEQRVQVRVPVMEAETAGVWARILQFHGSSGFGAFFMPEVGDEVVLGYFDQDPSHPVILGSLYSSKRAPPYILDARNDIKAIVTRCNSKIEFNEADKSISVTTPGNNKIVVSDEAILLHDRNDNKVELNTGGITLHSPRDITLSANGKISLAAIGAVSISSKADVKVAGLNISSEAQVALTAKGNASAELSAAGQTVVKGAMVMIN